MNITNLKNTLEAKAAQSKIDGKYISITTQMLDDILYAFDDLQDDVDWATIAKDTFLTPEWTGEELEVSKYDFNGVQKLKQTLGRKLRLLKKDTTTLTPKTVGLILKYFKELEALR